MFKIISAITIHLIASIKPSEYLINKISLNNQRYDTFLHAIELLEERNIDTLVETGTARYGADHFDSDGGSTIILSQWALEHDADFFSIDINSSNISTAKKALSSFVEDQRNKIHFVCNDSVTFFNNFGCSIDFLYLDSYDYEPDNPRPSQEHHLREIQAAYPLLTEKCVVMIDDCALPGGGKGKLVIDYLLQRDWKIVKDAYQVILIRNER